MVLKLNVFNKGANDQKFDADFKKMLINVVVQRISETINIFCFYNNKFAIDTCVALATNWLQNKLTLS